MDYIYSEIDTDIAIDADQLLPEVTSEDDGKILMVKNGVWTLIDLSSEI